MLVLAARVLRMMSLLAVRPAAALGEGAMGTRGEGAMFTRVACGREGGERHVMQGTQ